MKKIAIFFAAAAAVLAMSSCKQNTEPRYTPAFTASFVLNTPALADQYYELTPDGFIDLTWSQPKWGVSLVGNYKVQMSLDKSFKAAEGSDLPDYYDIDAEYTTCSASVPMEQVAIGLNALNGIKKEEQYVDGPAAPVFFRVVADVPQVPGSEVVSNVIELKQVKGYCAVQSPGKIYLVGAPEGWKGPDASAADHYADWALYEADDAIGSKIYYGTFEIPAGSAMFRFYTALTGWDADSWGSQADDNPLDFAFTDNSFRYTLVKGKGAFNFPAWAGGTMKMSVNMNTHELVIEAL